jgi:hypothetical protein
VLHRRVSGEDFLVPRRVRRRIDVEGIEPIVRHSRLERLSKLGVHVVPEAQGDAVRRSSEKEAWRGRSAGHVHTNEAPIVVLREQRRYVKAHQVSFVGHNRSR